MLGTYNSAILCLFIRHKHKLIILSRLSDFMTFSALFCNIQSEGTYLYFGTLLEDTI